MQSMPNYAQPIPAAQVSVPERLAFIRKVYGLLSISIFMAVIASWMTLSNEAFLMRIAYNPIISLVLFFGAFAFVYIAKNKETLGLVALFTFAIVSGIVITPTLLRYTGATVIQAGLLTGLIFIGLSLYTIVSKKDFSFLGGMLTVGLFVMIIGGLLNVFIFRSPAVSFLYSAVGVFIFSGFILYDTSNILKRYPTNMYITATLSLYLDILNLFLMLLHLLGGSRD